MARRLEDVRVSEGFEILKDFFSALADASPGDAELPGYNSALKYHSDRDAPASYLAAVSKRFGYSLMWLATGEGDRKPAPPGVQAQIDEWMDGRIVQGFPEFAAFPPTAKVQVYALIQRIFKEADQLPALQDAPVLRSELMMYAYLRTAFMHPLWGMSDMTWESENGKRYAFGFLRTFFGEDYLGAMVHTIGLALRIASPPNLLSQAGFDEA